MDPTKVDKRLVLLALAVLGPKIKQWTGYEFTSDDIDALLGAGVVLWHVLEVWQAKRAALPTPAPSRTGGYTPAGPPIADPAPPPKAP